VSDSARPGVTTAARDGVPTPAVLDFRLVPAALTAWAVAALGLGLPGTATLAVAALAAACAATLAMSRARWAATVATLLVAAAASGLCTGLRVSARDSGPLPALAGREAAAVLELEVRDDPRAVQARFGRTSYVVAARAVSVTAEGRTTRLGGRVLVLAGDPRWAGLLPSTPVRASGRLTPARGNDLTTAVVLARGPPQVLGSPSALQRAAGQLRAGLRRAVEPLPAAEQGLLPGLVVGDTSRLDPALAEQFRSTGLTHLTAVSGTNCTIVCGAVLLLARYLGLRTRGAALLAGLALAGFVVLARPSPSVLRAAVMGAVALLALALGRSRAALPALAAAVLVLVLLDPALSRAPGFLLSVLATSGLLLLAPSWRHALRPRLPGWAADAVAVPAAAQVATAPVVVVLSSSLSLVSLPVNLLAVPAVAPATVLGVLAAVLSVISPSLAEGVARLAGIPTSWLVLLAERGSAVPGGSVAWPGTLGGAAGLGLLLLAALVAGSRPAVRRLALAVLLGVALVAVPTRVVRPGWPPPDWLAVACDVGQGDALAVAVSPGTAIVVDAGPDPAAVDGCLRRLGIARVPLLVLSHLHADHVEGLAGVLRGRSVGAIQVGPLREPATGWLQVSRLAERHRVPIVAGPAGQVRVAGPVRLEVLGPVAAFRGTRSDPNNSSLLLSVTARGHRLLLTGDVEPEAQTAALSAGVDLSADVLKVPHHGSAHQAPAFLDAVRPQVALVSVGAGNDYGHPAPAVLSRLARGGARVLRTDISGDLAVAEVDGRLLVLARGRARGQRPSASRAPPSTADLHPGLAHLRAVDYRHPAGHVAPRTARLSSARDGGR